MAGKDACPTCSTCLPCGPKPRDKAQRKLGERSWQASTCSQAEQALSVLIATGSLVSGYNAGYPLSFPAGEVTSDRLSVLMTPGQSTQGI